MRVVGLTGGIACGKSVVSAQLRQKGFDVIDADVIAREVVEPGCWGYRRVLAAFGPEVLKPDGQLDREALASLVFTRPTARRRLNQATHPAVGLELVRQLLCAWLRGARVVVIDMPLLFESGAWRLCWPRVLVAASFQVQMSRLMVRDDLAHEAAAARVSSQMPLDQKRRRSDIVLQNDGSLEELQAQVDTLALKLRSGLWLHALLTPMGLLGLMVAAAAATLGLRHL